MAYGTGRYAGFPCAGPAGAPPVWDGSLAGTLSDEQQLSATLTLTGSTTALNPGTLSDEQQLSATLTVLTGLPSATLSDEQTLSGSLTLGLALASWTNDDYIEQFLDEQQLTGLLDLIPTETATPASVQAIQQVNVTMPAPTLVNGKPTQPWTATVARSTWATKLQLLVGSTDLSAPRGVPFIPLTDAATDPFGDADASFAFPGITEFDDPASFGLTPLAPIRLRRKDAGGTFHYLYCGFVASLEPDVGMGLIVHCIGTIYRTDLLKHAPDPWARVLDAGQIIASTFNRKRDRYGLHINHTRSVITGVQIERSAAFEPFLTGAVQNYLARIQDSVGDQWTVMLDRPWTPVIQKRDTTTSAFSVRYGSPGVSIPLPKDFTTAVNAVYATGADGHCSWQGLRMPNLVATSAPSFPLGTGHYAPGDGQTGFAPFAAYLRRGGYGSMVSDDTYDASDQDEIEQFQDRANLTVTGNVDNATWVAAFAAGQNQGSIGGSYIGPIWERKETRRYDYNAQGAIVGENPAFDPVNWPRIEDYIPFGDNVSRRLGRTSAKQDATRANPAGRLGTVTFTSDPPGMSRWDIEAGMNFTVTDLAGGSVVVHIARRERDWLGGAVTCTVDEKSRDLLTAASIYQRRRDVSDHVRREKFGRTKSQIFNDYGVWACEDGAGEIPLIPLTPGQWKVQRIPAPSRGSIVAISLGLGTGLTEHVLNQLLADDSTLTLVPGPARGHMSVYAKAVTADMLYNTPGGSNPLTALPDGSAWTDHNQQQLDQWGLLYSAGGPGNAIGFWPNNDPGDGTSTNLSGIYHDGGGIPPYGPTGYGWLWVAVYIPPTEAAGTVAGGRLYPAPPD